MDEITIKKLLGLRIKQLRKKNNLTQFELGEKINIDQRQIAYIEGGNCFPSLKTLKKLSDVFDCQMKDLFDYEHLLDKIDFRNEIQQKLKHSNDKNLEVYYRLIDVVEKVL